MSTVSFDLKVRPRIVSCWSGLKQIVGEWCRRGGSRRELAKLNEIDLKDIGMCRSSAEFEANKPFWIS
jgi:uncharacterized protein YjiS (DUF1127 family)